MSTKASIAYGDDFHFYTEVLENDCVYLEMSGYAIEFEAGPKHVMVRIPAHVWGKIRDHVIPVHAAEKDSSES